MKKTKFFIINFLLFAGVSCVYAQLEISFTSKYKGNWCQMDSVLIENINTGSKTVNYYPDTLLQLIITGIEEPKNPVELKNLTSFKIYLNQNYPNPFTGTTNFNIFLLEDVNLTISIYNILGKLLLNYEEQLPAGNHPFTFSGGEEEIYFLIAKTPGYSSAIKMINLGSGINTSGLTLNYNGHIPLGENDYGPVDSKSNNLKSENVISQKGEDRYITVSDKQNKYPGRLKSGLNEIGYSPGDSLMLIGYMTNDSDKVISDTIIERPEKSKTITFLYEKQHRVLLILYHVITDSIPGNEYERNTADFENDLKYMIGTGCQFLSINDLLLLQSGAMKLYTDGIIITFDDGDTSNYTRAFPLLTEYNIPATFFIVPEWIGDSSFMTWPEVYQMSQYVNSDGIMPFTIGSHTSSHPHLEESAQNFIDHQDYLNFLYTELEDSRVWIVDITGQENIFLSLPYGDGEYNTDIINTAITSGYKGIRTSEYFSFTVNEMNMYALPGVSMLSNYSIQIIEEFLELW